MYMYHVHVCLRERKREKESKRGREEVEINVPTDFSSAYIGGDEETGSKFTHKEIYHVSNLYFPEITVQSGSGNSG